MKKKIVFIIAQNDFRDEELFAPKKYLESRGIDVKVASKIKGLAKSKFGKTIKTDMAITEVKVKDFDAVVFSGGRGCVEYFEDEAVLNLVRDFYRSGRLVAAICAAVMILANAGLLLNKKATGYTTHEETLKNRGAEYTGMDVEVDGKIITGKDAMAVGEFAEKIYWMLGE